MMTYDYICVIYRFTIAITITPFGNYQLVDGLRVSGSTVGTSDTVHCE